MSKLMRLIGYVLLTYMGIAFLHVWMNIGFSRIAFINSGYKEEFRVGFLPVT